MTAIRPTAAIWGLFWFLVTAGEALARPADDPVRQLGWFNATDLSLVLTAGNSSARTLGVSNTVRRVWETARLQFDFSAVDSDRADDRFFLADPGLRFVPGDQPAGLATTLVKPDAVTDVANYLIGARVDKDINEYVFWNTGASWDRNEDAGIVNRYVLFAGVGNIWRASDSLQFSTDYGISYTDREEERPDSDKDRRFAGARLAWNYLNGFGEAAVYKNDLTANMNVADTSDYSLKMTNSVSASMNANLSLKVSLQWLYEHDPALEDIDIIARVVVVDPDGTPGSGDEFFETASAAGTETALGMRRVRNDRLDAIFRTALVISF